MKTAQSTILSLCVLCALVSSAIVVANPPKEPDLTADQPTAQDPHPRFRNLGRGIFMATVLPTGARPTRKDAVTPVSLVIINDRSLDLKHVPAVPATPDTAAWPEGTSIEWPVERSTFASKKLTTDNMAGRMGEFSLRLFFGNDGSSRMLPILNGTPLDNHIHVLPVLFAKSSYAAPDVTLFVPSSSAGQVRPLLKGTYPSDFLSKLEAVPASGDTPTKPWGIVVTDTYSVSFKQTSEGTVCDTLSIFTLFRDDGTVGQAGNLLTCHETKQVVVTVKGKGGKPEQRTQTMNGRNIARPITDNHTRVLDLAQGRVALLVRDNSPSAKGPWFIGVYDSRQLEKDATSATIAVSEFYLMSDGRVLTRTRIFGDDGPPAHRAAVEDRLLDNQAQELPLAGGEIAVFVKDTQPGATGPLLKEIRETYPAAPLPIDLLGTR